MSRVRTATVVATALLAAAVARPADNPPIDVVGLLARVGERVQAFYERAQSIVCTETISYEFLDSNNSLTQNPGNRRLTYDLRLSWEKSAESDVPDGTALRTLKAVNGRPPRKGDEPHCLDPKPTAIDSLSFLLPQHQKEFTFTYKGIGKVGDGHSAVMVDYVPTSKAKPTIKWTDECFSFDAPARTRGRVWIDRFGGDVLRIDETVDGPIDVDVPRDQERKSGVATLVLDRSATSIHYKTVAFTDPNEYVLLPDTEESMVILRGMSRQRTRHTYTDYKRFETGGRLLPPGSEIPKP